MYDAENLTVMNYLKSHRLVISAWFQKQKLEYPDFLYQELRVLVV